MFELGKVYRRKDLQSRFGGQAQGGISTPSKHPIILLFTGEAGKQYGYDDDLDKDGIFLYTGEGQKGDMSFIRGNRAIRDHAANGKDLHLFKYVAKGQVRYLGQMVCTGYHMRPAPDVEGNQRKAIVFELSRHSDFLGAQSDSQDSDAKTASSGLWAKPAGELRALARQAADSASTPRERKVVARARSQAVRIYIRKRASGLCEGCGSPAPFEDRDGHPYLEPHHIRRLSDGGPDDPRWVVALCPNCHSRVHYGAGGPQYNRSLAAVASAKERE